MNEPTITCCVFAWNEVATLARVIDELLGELRSLGASFELVIIDDGSNDGTGELADRIAEEHTEVRVVHHGENRGLGGAYRTGFDTARGTYLTFFPADGQFPASILSKFYPLVESYDFVLGNLPQRRGSLRGRFLSRVERILYGAMFGRIPRLEGVFMFRRSTLDTLPLKSEGRGWAIVMELVIRAGRSGMRMIGVPITMKPREVGSSKVNNLRTIRANVQQLARLRLLL